MTTSVNVFQSSLASFLHVIMMMMMMMLVFGCLHVTAVSDS